ncbi:MAG: 50S ribosomal protein L25/general stress protein Ctc [Rhodobiaceae bacterium]|nr:50S ribosomal protein L25/general stress protein Ctc [Rhodobiaceae bacterium]MCC0011808.1 50S ribosomal protein L25/general stress protein Ctc [Rhodobiaceae bacterium]MCC0050535.1 50S ribosomal protein L25/general stress protein Ctc [Rhodobiaceae bacterium]MCC0061274.1 50S ribosomal protein L25/general stress protein Ctc [Rhodobiaceae bacterium]
MSATVQLKAEPREKVGKGAARAARRSGLVPAVIYGDKKDPRSISLTIREVEKQLESGHFLNTIYEIDVAGEKSRVIPRDYQMHPVKDVPMHIDFLRIAKGARLVVAVPVAFQNEDSSPGLRKGGVLNIVRHEIEISAPADAIPSEIAVDLTGLDLGDSLHISAVTLPEGVTPTITDRDFTIATIAAPAGLKSEGEEDEEGAEPGEVPAMHGGDEEEAGEE